METVKNKVRILTMETMNNNPFGTFFNVLVIELQLLGYRQKIEEHLISSVDNNNFLPITVQYN